MNIATDIQIEGRMVTVYGHYTAPKDAPPRVRFECADDENGNAVDLNISAEQQAEKALLDEVTNQNRIYGPIRW